MSDCGTGKSVSQQMKDFEVTFTASMISLDQINQSEADPDQISNTVSSNDITLREQQNSDQTAINTSCTTAFSKFCKHSLREFPQDAPTLVPLISYDNRQSKFSIPPQSTSLNVELKEHNKAIHRADRERSKGMIRCKSNGENYASIQETFRSIEESDSIIVITPMTLSGPYVDPIQFRCLRDTIIIIENLVGDHDRKSLSELDISPLPLSTAIPYQDDLPNESTSQQNESDPPVQSSVHVLSFSAEIESESVLYRDNLPDETTSRQQESDTPVQPSMLPPATESVPYQEDLPDETILRQNESDPPVRPSVCVLPFSAEIESESVPYQDSLLDETISRQNESASYGQHPSLDSHRISLQSANESIHTSIPSDSAGDIICPEVQSKREQEQVLTAIATSPKSKVSDATEESQYGVHSYSTPPTGHKSTLLNLLKNYSEKNPSTTICLPKKDISIATLSSRPILQPLHDIPARTLVRLPETEYNLDILPKFLHGRNYTQIIQFFGEISNRLPQLQDDFILLHFVTGIANFKLSEYKEARRHFQECERAAKQVFKNGDVMLCNAYLGDIEYADQSYSEAAQYYKAAIKYYSPESMADMLRLSSPTLSAIHAKCASTFRNMSNLVEAMYEYRMAIDMAQTNRNRLTAHTSLGNVYQCMNDNSSALKEYNISITLAEMLGDYVILGWIHGNIGNAYLGLNEKDKAIHHFLKSLDLAIEHEHTPQAIGRAYNNLGTAYQSMSNIDKAEECYDLALTQAVHGNDIAGQALAYGNIGNIHMHRKNYERAIAHYSEVFQLSKDPATLSTAQHNRGCAYYEWATSIMRLHHQTPDSKKLHIHGPNCNHDCIIPHKVQILYRKGANDLEEVVNYHEQRFEHIKAHKGLTMSLSVSLFEANPRTFHRLQDCLVNLHRWDEALVVAEQSRARSLGELMFKRNANNGGIVLPSPKLSFDAIVNIISRLKCPLVYLSYTGNRLLGWVFIVSAGEPTMNSFEVHLSNDKLEGESLEYYLQYTLTEKLVERSFEMYQSISYNEDSNSPVQKLHQLITAPIEEILNRYLPLAANKQIICIPDRYTNLLPLACLYDAKAGSFFGDRFCFRLAPSLLSLGILDLVSEPRITLQDEKQEICVIGDPSIPPFILNGEVWNLCRLPYARREAEWVAHVLQTTPILKENATKVTFFNRAMRAKLIHIATHGSASSGFLAFAGCLSRSSEYHYVSSESVILYPEDVENFKISTALVVLSSCDSGCGIQSMARAFILAGAQSVLTTLWKIPDESASVFMQFFYRYLLDGYQSSLALQKAILSIRCFAKYSQYIHWGGYQLIGVDVELHSSKSTESIENRLGKSSTFPRLAEIKRLEKALVNNPLLPTDVQVYIIYDHCLQYCNTILYNIFIHLQMLRGSVGVDPSEIAIDFITSYHNHFSGGIFWINCQMPEMICYSIENIEKVSGTVSVHA